VSRAVQLDPKNPLYRNNIATVLVDKGEVREAFGHLREVHSDAAAYYNIGYLLNKKGQPQAAMQSFALAVKADPSMDAARRWLEYLQRTTAQARLSQLPMSTGVRVTSPPATPQVDALSQREEPTPQRLPPTTLSKPTSEGPTLPGISYDWSAAPAAPMPPPSTNSAVRPLPRMN
jgi:tetratricopeptide (TPR) repeat protein